MAFSDSKPHYEILDGLRGVAALLVLFYHIAEGYSFAYGTPIIEGINHGYLAVDFFFILSGFVLGYAYDDRWKKGFSLKEFFRRRLIRLHPMVILGAIVGATSFVLGGCLQWDGTHIAISSVMLSLLMAMFMIPAVPGCPYEVRGNGEMFPLNGPSWSLFFEYIGNILYALFIRRLSTRALAVLTVILGAGLAGCTLADVGGGDAFGLGWTLDWLNFGGGLLRMLFPFTLGMLISRKFRPVRVRYSFALCSVVLLSLFIVPYIPKVGGFSLNGVYELVCKFFVFPTLLYLGASGHVDGRTERLCRFLGDLSYPLYMTHYPVMYLFYAYLIRCGEKGITSFWETWPLALLAVAVSLALGWLCTALYDKPVRKKLSALGKSGK